MENNREISRNINSNNEYIDIRDVLTMLLKKWQWFIISIVLFFGIAWVYIKVQQPQYQRSAVILVKSDKNNRNNNFDIMSINSGLVGTGVENELFMLRTRMNMRQVVRNLHLDISYSSVGYFRDYPLYKYIPFTVNFLNEYSQKLDLIISLVSDSKYEIVSINGDDVSVIGEYGKKITVGDDTIVVNPTEYNSTFIGRQILVSRMSLEAAAALYQSEISTDLVSENSTLVAIRCVDTNAARASAILNSIINVYNESIIQDKNNVTTSTARFIDDRLLVISRELGQVEDELTEFKQKNSIVDLSSSATQYLTESYKIRSDAVSIETEIAVANMVKRYLSDESRTNQLIPNVAGIEDNGIQIQINNYNDLMLQRNRLITNSGENNSVIRNMDSSLASMRVTISGAIDNYIDALRVRLTSVNKVEEKILSNIHSVPDQEKVALGIMRQQNIKETLYTYLLQKREENALQMAVTETNIRVVEEPVGSGNPIKPVTTSIFMVAFILGIGTPLICIILGFFWNTTVRGRRDVEEYTTLPILGEIPQRDKKKDDDELVVTENSNNGISEAFRMLRANMSFMAKDAKVLMFISTIPGEGKTFVSRNFAVTLQLLGKKVIIVDTDLRKRTQSILAKHNTNNGLSYYLAGQTNNIKDIIVRNAIANVDLLPAGAIPPNPSELLMSDRFDSAISELREIYDYIILDNVPAQAVADASVVNRVADITLYVVRDRVLDRRALPDIEMLHREKKFHNMCIVINGCTVSKKNYGYYGYSYGYYSDSKKKKSIRAMIRSIFTRH